MKIISKFLVVLVALAFFTGCASTEKEAPRRAGELPNSWWTKDIDALENQYRDVAEGVEQKVKLFVGISDEPTNATESDAIEDATRKVSVEISRYLVQVVTNISQSSQTNDYIKQVVADSGADAEESTKFVNDIKNQTNNFTASITTTQFSTMKIIGKHAEKAEEGNKYKGWVCVSMTDAILDQTQKLQEAAFNNILELNPEYKQVIADINTAMTKSIKENITEKSDF
ncbi:MAG: hypothetical protein OCD02_13530 [Spirochaetaceae bacterium]